MIPGETQDQSWDVAISGIAARLPGAGSGRWRALLEGRTLLRTPADAPGAVGAERCLIVHGYLSDAERFDHRFFRISPCEAELMDPQHRLKLEFSWAALEDAADLCVAPGSEADFVGLAGDSLLAVHVVRLLRDATCAQLPLHTFGQTALLHETLLATATEGTR
ncbi:beta-ketoacyl synthase N-terminal-like domain-containing protein [Streptomyces sp. NPDC001142]